VAAFVLAASRADAQAISGTFTGKFTGCDAGVPHVALAISLTCGLTCAAGNSRSFGVSGLFDAYLQASDQQSVGNVGTGMVFDLKTTGSSSADNDSFPVGANLIARANGATCQCGGKSGEGGFITLLTAPVQIPPNVTILLDPVVVGAIPFPYISIAATPAPSETVAVRVSGAGIDKVFHFTSADFHVPSSGPVRQGTMLMSIEFAAPGKATITASVAGGPPFSTTFPVLASP
jgi:hypothetical protein